MRSLLLHAAVAWRTGLRSHGFVVVLIFGVLLMGVSFLAAAFSLRQPLVVAMDVGLSGIRLLTLLLVLFWMQEVFAKDIDKRTLLVALSYPASRASYLFGRYLGVITMVAAAIILFGVLLVLLNRFSVWGYADSSVIYLDARYGLILLGIFLDAAVVAAFAMWLMTLAETPFLAMGLGFFFALAGRSLGPVLEYLLRPQGADAETIGTFLPWLQVFQWVLPDLSRLDWRGGVLYDVWPDFAVMAYAALMAAAYSMALMGLAWWRFANREFN